MLFLFIHWLSEHLQSSCVSLHFNDILSHFKRKQNQLRTSHSGLGWSILNAAHCGQGEEQMGHSSCEPIICCLISRVGHVLFSLKTPICLCFGGNPFLQIECEALCHLVLLSMYYLQLKFSILFTSCIYFFLAFLLHPHFKSQFGPSY